jgi:hypothetical protein
MSCVTQVFLYFKLIKLGQNQGQIGWFFLFQEKSENVFVHIFKESLFCIQRN